MLLLAGTSSLQTAVANGDTRTITFHHLHTGETATFTFKKNGSYDQATLEKLNWFMRDWRKNEPTKMDPHLFDVIWEVYRATGAKDTIQVVGGYRSPGTNAMLRSRSRGVAKFSQHTLGKAMDFFIPGVKLSDLREAGLRLQRGGVGFYPTSGSPFVHMDTGSVRHWPRMTYDQLARVFPDGKTVHLPTTGKPLAHYAEAAAELRARGTNDTAFASNDGGKGVKTFFAALMGKKDADEEEAGGADEASAAGEAPEAAAEKPASRPVAVAAAPLPAARPAEIAGGALLAQAATQAPLTQAPLVQAPMPQRRPSEIAAGSTQMASLASPLPPVITRGVRETAQEGSSALGYANADPLETASAPNPVAAARPRGQGRASGAPHDGAPAQHASAGEAPNGVSHGGLFSPVASVKVEAALAAPQYAATGTVFTPPARMVDAQFAPAGGGRRQMVAQFTGQAVTAVPTQVFPPSVRLTQRM